jgi:GTP cyclohydrolase III
MRPAGFEPAQKAKPASTGLKTSAADKMRATIAGMKKVSVSPSASGTSTPTNASAGKKRAHLGTDEDAAKRPRKNANDAPKAKAEKKMTLDQREKAIKAAKKAAKKNKAT